MIADFVLPTLHFMIIGKHLSFTKVVFVVAFEFKVNALVFYSIRCYDLQEKNHTGGLQNTTYVQIPNGVESLYTQTTMFYCSHCRLFGIATDIQKFDPHFLPLRVRYLIVNHKLLCKFYQVYHLNDYK